MMSSSIYGLSNYYNAFVSPMKAYQVSPITNLMYGAVASNVYAKTVAKSAQSSVSSYLSSMKTPSIYVVSSDSSAVSGSAVIGAGSRTYSIKVSHLAAAQVNKTAEVADSETTSLKKGYNSMVIKSGSSEKTVSFIIDDRDNNKAALNKIANAINKSDSGVKASVAAGSMQGTSYLQLESVKTGVNKAFTIKDDIGNTLSSLGLDKINEKARDAVYTVDGKQYKSGSNTVSFDNGKIQATLQKAGDGEISLTVGSNNNNANDYNTYYNNLVSSGKLESTAVLFSGSILDLFL